MQHEHIYLWFATTRPHLLELKEKEKGQQFFLKTFLIPESPTSENVIPGDDQALKPRG